MSDITASLPRVERHYIDISEHYPLLKTLLVGVRHYCLVALAWAESQYIDSSNNTKTKSTLKCCYVLHSYVGTIFSHDKLCA